MTDSDTKTTHDLHAYIRQILKILRKGSPVTLGTTRITLTYDSIFPLFHDSEGTLITHLEFYRLLHREFLKKMRSVRVPQQGTQRRPTTPRESNHDYYDQQSTTGIAG